MEKTLPLSADSRPIRTSNTRPWLLRLAIVLFVATCAFANWNGAFRQPHSLRVFPIDQPSKVKSDASKSKLQCHQPAPLIPPVDEHLDRLFDYLSTSTFENGSVARLSGAVRVQTESFDDLGTIGEDKRWDVFYPFHDYLKATFPRIHEELKLEKVNTHGLLYTWQGSDAELKPTVLMAHQDVVPVEKETIGSWTFPPWSGHYDGTSVWGRGSSDCKNSLIGIMETVELLLEAGFEPKRTIIMSFGFDEECSGRQGAGHLAPFLHDRYGDNGIAAIVDEGMGYVEAFGRGFAFPGVAEKGYTDVEIVVRTPGGHSSIPAPHTSIGILSEIITVIEAQHYRTYLDDTNPILGFLACGAKHAPDFPKKLRKLLRDHDKPKKCKAKPDHLAIEAAKISPAMRYLMQTSQAVDLIQGGAKVNALPETAKGVVNHRINIGDEPATVYNHLAHLIRPIAKKHNLTFHAFDGEREAYRSVSLYANNQSTLPPAPVSPTDTEKLTAYSVLSGTIRALYGEDTIVAPAIMTANTDTRHYWALSRNIFRFGAGYVNEIENSLGNIHTVDEHIAVSNHIKVVKWYTLFLRNMDAADLEETN